MNKIKQILAVALMAVVAVSASAQFRVGPRVGVEVNKMHFNESTFSADNRAGFTGGVMAEFTVPIVGIGMDASLMYVHRNNTFNVATQEVENKCDYLEIPINLKYKLGLPAVGKIVTPYIFTGPSFAVRCSKKAIQESIDQKSCDIAWNIGLGVQLINHLQIGASYGFGINKAFNYTLSGVTGVNGAANTVEGKNKYWTVTAAWLF